jgi:single-stranded DNA-specific DHH superfamily exonuclease
MLIIFSVISFCCYRRRSRKITLNNISRSDIQTIREEIRELKEERVNMIDQVTAGMKQPNQPLPVYQELPVPQVVYSEVATRLSGYLL